MIQALSHGFFLRRPSRSNSPLALVLVWLLLVSQPQSTWAHPGAVADGRATCGTEYSTADSAYAIPDIREAWYLRRVSTCESPVFWTKFDIVNPNQRIYIAVISPELERFQDQLKFHGILYGNGLGSVARDGLSAVPDQLPEGIILDPELAATGAGYLTSPDRFDSCAFVDTNAVMRRFSDLHEGRCMEEFTLSNGFSDALQQSTTSWSWWIYSFNHQVAEPGTYYLQTWLTSRNDTTTVAQGKYEMTLGPWTWSGYASEATLELAQQQGTSCSCAVNALDYKENYVERLGDLDQSFQQAQLPGASCSKDNTNNSPCVTIPQKTYMTDGSAVEWSGFFQLEANRTYEWTFHAYYQGSESSTGLYDYPDPGMYVVIFNASDVASVALTADEILTNAVEDDPLTVVMNGDTLDLVAGQAQYILFANTSHANSTTVLLEPTLEATSFAFFTQHVPSEFMAHVLRDADSGEYVFPATQTLYVEGKEELVAEDDGDDELVVVEEEEATVEKMEEDVATKEEIVADEEDGAIVSASSRLFVGIYGALAVVWTCLVV